ncbi:hypothetical protein [Ancylobacter radicis]|uniref:DNA-directed DNA polymerase family A palm domain-containing protein n=1 Tax=Ancylobacter radicis TaxID=2836179 RepID=A0ABS5RBG1_9HYPH|nr:hypothetical protein [Ancylobacter radicis]MBS9478995.1 hypothetical protein [Ancylobacter radicis]
MDKPFHLPERHRWFDDWRGARGPALRKLVVDITGEVEALERAKGARKRARKAVDQSRFEVAVEVVVSNLANEVLVPSETGRLAIITGNGAKGAARYDNTALGKPLRDLLARMTELELIDWHKPASQRDAWSVSPAASFRTRVESAGIRTEDFGRVAGEETIVLTRKGRRAPGSGGVVRQLVDYIDTSETVAMRQAMERLNSVLSSADIAFVDDGAGPVDVHNRAMRRHFITALPEGQEFDRGGRLFGGFWQNLPSARRGGIRINGEPVAELDYGQMAVRLAYAHVGATPPEGDMYALPGLIDQRAAVKTAFNVLLNDSHRRNSWPAMLLDEGEKAEPSEVLPVGWTVKKVKAAVLSRHPALAPCLGSGIGLKLMHTESEMLVAVLTEMQARGIVGLGIHDGLLAPASKADEVARIMSVVGETTTGTTIPVTASAL